MLKYWRTIEKNFQFWRIFENFQGKYQWPIIIREENWSIYLEFGEKIKIK